MKTTYYTISITEKTIRKGKSKAGIGKFVFITDLHNKEIGKKNAKLLQAIDEERPDFILCTGDMIIAKPGYSMDVAIAFIEEISKKYTVYYANGNHEYRMKRYPDKYGDMYEQYKMVLDRCNVIHLENRQSRIQVGEHTIWISGLDMDREYYKRFQKTPMDETYIAELLGIKKTEYTILLAHHPGYFPQYAKWGAELTLSGHYHGGVVRLPVLGGVVSPQFELFPKYSGGLYLEGEKAMVLGCGLGEHTIPFRLWNPPELVSITIED